MTPISFNFRGWTTPLPILLATAILPTAPETCAAQEPEHPRYFAIRNARIVTVSGATIPRGTIVLSGGVIAAVGPEAAIPPEAWVIDGNGLTVYPGLIDALTSLGNPGNDDANVHVAAKAYSRGPEDRPATTSWVNAADDFDIGDERIRRWREAGFTSAVISPSEGIFPGQAALINLAGTRSGEMIVKTPVALRINLSRGDRYQGFPGSLMGAIAYVRQLFLDAAHYAHARSVYDASPQGLERPEYDRALEPLRTAIDEGHPVLFPATWAREIHRAVRLGNEVGANTVLYGAQQAYEVPDALASSGAAVLVSLAWPSLVDTPDPETDDPLRQLRFWDRAPSTPAALHRSGVQFGFYTDGITDPEEALRNARLAIDAGLPRDAAVHAMTLGAADIYGVADRLGSLERGKIANILVTDGDLFADGTKVRMVFVDGRKYDAPASQETEGSGTPPAPKRPTRGQSVTAVVDRGPLQSPPVTVIRNATILTVSNGIIDGGSVLIRDGKIGAVGRDITVPPRATIIDAAGQCVMPGIIDAHSHIATDAVNEGTTAVSAMVGIEDVLNPDQIAIYRAIAGGVTTANVLHGSANPIGGKTRSSNSVGERTPGGSCSRARRRGLGENPKRSRTPPRYPATRMGVLDVIRQAFLEAETYRADWREHERRRARGDAPLIRPVQRGFDGGEGRGRVDQLG